MKVTQMAGYQKSNLNDAATSFGSGLQRFKFNLMIAYATNN